MDSKQEKSWTITEVVDLVKDLGPRENTSFAYRRFKENLKKLSPSGPTWEPPGEAGEKKLKGLANDGLQILVGLRESRQIQLPTDRQNETHRKLLEATKLFQEKMKLQEQQVALDRAYEEMRQRAYDPWNPQNPRMENGGIVTSLTRWANAVTEPDCSYNWS